VKVELSEEAEEQVRAIDAWWRQNRRAATDLFLAELEDALTRLEEIPTLGSRYVAGSQNVRRLFLRRPHYHLYIMDRPNRLLVVAVWNAYRGRGPRL
jgi:plasmid stabilization system protein ParE